MKKLDDPNFDKAILQEKIAKAPPYDSYNRKKVKYTKEVDEFLDEILAMEKKKDELLKNYKQQLSVVQIHKMIKDRVLTFLTLP